MKKYICVIIWDTGEKETYEYDSLIHAEQCEKNFKKAFGNQIQWTGVYEKHE